MNKKEEFLEWIEAEREKNKQKGLEMKKMLKGTPQEMYDKKHHEYVTLQIIRTRLAQSESILELEQKCFELLRKLSIDANKGLVTRDVEAYRGIMIKKALNQINIILSDCRG